MTIVRVDAAGTLLGQWTRTGGTTHHGVISDGSDPTYVTAPVTAAGASSDEWFSLGSWSSPGASYSFKRWRIVYRMSTNGGGTGPNTRMKIQCGKIAFYYAGKLTGATTLYSGWNTTIPSVNDVLAVAYKPTAAQNLQPRITELYLELEYNDKPVVTVTAPTGAVSEIRPKIYSTWADTDNDIPDRYTVWVHTAGQYGAPGFVPGVGAYYWGAENVIVNGGVIPTITIGKNLANGTTYKAYLKARQPDGVWSDYASSPAFNTVYDEPEQGVVTVAAGGWLNQKVVATVKSGINLLTQDEYSLPNLVAAMVGTGSLSTSATQSYIGSQSAKVTVTGTSDAGMELTRLVPVVAGSKYKFIGRVYPTAAQTTRNGTVRVKWYQSDGTTLISTYTYAGSSCAAGGWRLVTDTNITAPALAAYAKIAFYSVGAINTESYYWDDIQFAPNSDVLTAGSMGGLAAEPMYAHLYRSIDAGTTWELCADPVVIPTANQVVAITDPAPPLGVALHYSTIITPTETSTGDEWPTPRSASATITVTPATGACWIVRDAQDATVDGVILDVAYPNPWTWKSDEQMAKFAGLGRRYPLIVADNLTRARTIDGLTFEFTVEADYDDFWAMREAQHVIALTRVPTLEQWYFRILSDVSVQESNTSPIVFQVRMNVAEVANPAVDND